MAVATALIAGYSAYTIQNENKLTESALTNIEALASNTESSGKTYYCWSSFSGGISFPRQCPSCIRLPFSTGVGTSGTCN